MQGFGGEEEEQWSVTAWSHCAVLLRKVTRSLFHPSEFMGWCEAGLGLHRCEGFCLRMNRQCQQSSGFQLECCDGKIGLLSGQEKHEAVSFSWGAHVL